MHRFCAVLAASGVAVIAASDVDDGEDAARHRRRGPRIIDRMRILYGVVGEGMGHAIRSRVVLAHLLERGHDIEVMASGRAQTFLAQHFPRVNDIHGFHLVSAENRVQLGKTLWSNILAGAAKLPKNIAAYFDLIDDFEPEVVISDFESWTYYYGKVHRLPVLSVDNMQIINRCEHPAEILEGHRTDFQIAKALVKSKLPFCEHYFITSFFRPRVRKDRTTLHPPILRREILGAERRRGEHLLVYTTAASNDQLADVLQRTGLECRVYGMRRDLTVEQVEGNLRYRPFSNDGFIADLASARAVVSTAGFTLMGEAVYLRKPMLAVPLDNQFEQLLNARYLQREGYGRCASRLDDPRQVQAFIDNLPAYEERLASYEQDGNRDLLGAVDRRLEVL